MTPPPFLRRVLLLGWLSTALQFPCALTAAPTPAGTAENGEKPWVTALRAQEKALGAAMDKMPPSLGLLSRRGDVRLFLANFQGALEDYEAMVALDPAQDAPHWRLGIAYYFTGHYQKAARQFEKYHAYDARDRENGVWKFFSQARAEGIEKARKEMLEYTQFDREPFPSVYRLLAGGMTTAQLLEELKSKGLQAEPGVVFFAKYYAGWMEFLEGRKREGLQLVQEAVAQFTPETAGRGGPGYMWHTARVHAALLEADSKP